MQERGGMDTTVSKKECLRGRKPVNVLVVAAAVVVVTFLELFVSYCTAQIPKVDNLGL